MKSIFVWLALLCFASPVFAGDWAKNLETAPGTAPVPASVKSGSFQYFMFIPNTDTAASDSSYIFIPSGFRVSVWLDENLAANAHGTGNNITIKMLWWPSTAIGAPPASDLKSIHLLGKTLNGVASTGSTTDAIYDIDGPGYLKADITTAPLSNDALLILGITERL